MPEPDKGEKLIPPNIKKELDEKDRPKDGTSSEGSKNKSSRYDDTKE